MILQKCIAVIFILFFLCFMVIAIEETFLGGRRRRKLERELRRHSGENTPAEPGKPPLG